MNRTTKIVVLKHTVYVLLLLFCYVLQTTPDLFVIAGIKPVLVIPIAVVIAMQEGEFIGCIYGTAAGFLHDMNSSALFGYHALMTAVCCTMIGLFVIYLVQYNLLGCLLFVSATLLIQGSIAFLFTYGMWGHESVWKLYVFYTLPTTVYSVAATIPIFGGLRWIYLRFSAFLKP